MTVNLLYVSYERMPGCPKHFPALFLSALILVIPAFDLRADQAAKSRLSEFFEGRTVTVKLDMPGTHQGVDVYPQRPQPLDLKSYSNRLKQYGISLRSGDSALVTKVKVKDDNVEFQLAGGGYGTSGDDTDTSVHFTSAEKSGREKDLEAQLKGEQNSDKRRALQRELDEARSYRQRRDQHERELAEQAAEIKKQTIMNKRLQGGSRFNLRMDVKNSSQPITPELIMASLSPYLNFTTEPASRSAAAPPATPSLSKGMTREQVEAIFGPATEAHTSQNGLTLVSCTYETRDSIIKADFVNDVLVQYTVSSR